MFFRFSIIFGITLVTKITHLGGEITPTDREGIRQEFNRIATIHILNKAHNLHRLYNASGLDKKRLQQWTINLNDYFGATPLNRDEEKTREQLIGGLNDMLRQIAETETRSMLIVGLC